MLSFSKLNIQVCSECLPIIPWQRRTVLAQSDGVHTEQA